MLIQFTWACQNGLSGMIVQILEEASFCPERCDVNEMRSPLYFLYGIYGKCLDEERLNSVLHAWKKVLHTEWLATS